MPSAVPEPVVSPMLALLNPGARNAAAAREALASDRRFRSIELAPGQLAEQVTRAAAIGASRVLVAGGDGTLRQAAEVLRRTRTALAVLPAGTRNHFARDFDIPLDPAGALEVPAAGTIRTVDLGLVDGHVILNTSSVGAYPSYVRLRRRLDPWIGYHAASLLAGLVALRRHRRFAVTLELEGKHLRYDASLVFVGVGERSLDRPTPGSRKTGGARVLHVFVVHERSRIRIAGLMMRALTRGIPSVGEERGVHGFLVNACTIEMTERESQVALDGELVRLGGPFNYRIERDALQVVQPGPDPASH